MIKQLIAGLCLIIPVIAFSQENNASPYSYYGIGDIKFKGTADTRAMGGLGFVPDSIHVNLQNPATYSSLLLTTFSVSGSSANTSFKTSDASDDASRTTLDYLTLAIPFNKLGFAIGLMPYTSVGYKILDEEKDQFGNTVSSKQFGGSGGLNRVFFGASYKITPKLSVGADFQYNFGSIETKSLTDLGTQYVTRETNSSDYNGVSFNIGATYQTKLNDRLTWSAGATYTPQSTLSSSTERMLALITYSGRNEIVVDELDLITAEEDIKMPSKISFGTGFGESFKWFLGAEYTFTESNQFGNRFDEVTNAAFQNSHKFSLGGYFIPKYTSFTSYLSRVTYRAGLKFEKTGLVINNQDINDYGVSVGLGLPMGGLGSLGSISNINLGLEVGRRGTTAANLIQENYMNFFVSLSLNDKWFVKRKYE